MSRGKNPGTPEMLMRMLYTLNRSTPPGKLKYSSMLGPLCERLAQLIQDQWGIRLALQPGMTIKEAGVRLDQAFVATRVARRSEEAHV